MGEKCYSVGEMATMACLSVRTLQHYDNIGLLPASRNPASDRRYYTKADLARLEQILFYKALGFSLADIRANLTDARSLSDLRELFAKQEYLLLRKMERLHTAVATIEASVKVLDAGSLPPFEVTLQFLSLLPGDDIFEWAPSLLDAGQKAALSELFKNFDEAQSFYHSLKSSLIDGLVLFHAHIPPTHLQAQELAQKWQAMIRTVSSDNPAALELFIQIGRNSRFASSQSQKLMEDVYQYIQLAVECLNSNQLSG